MFSSDVLARALAPLLLAPQALIVAAFAVLVVAAHFVFAPRRFYFVRHGETLLNVKRVRQGSEGRLSPRGEQQALAAAKYLKHFRVRRIIASPFERARQTASIIAGELKCPVRVVPLFAERKSPSEVVGKSGEDPLVKHITEQIEDQYHADDDYRYSDEENFAELKARARRALDYLAAVDEREVCVVTHGVFLKVLVAYLLYRERLHSGDYMKLNFFNAASNGTITVCDYHPWRRFSATRGWEVIHYNEVPPMDA